MSDIHIFISNFYSFNGVMRQTTYKTLSGTGESGPNS